MSKKNGENNKQSTQSNNTLDQASNRLAGSSNKSAKEALEKVLRPSSTITERASTPSNSGIITITPPNIKRSRMKNKSHNAQKLLERNMKNYENGLKEASVANNGRYQFVTNKHGNPISNSPGELDKIYGPVSKFGGPYSAFNKVGGRKSVRNKKNKKKNKKSKNKSIKRQK